MSDKKVTGGNRAAHPSFLIRQKQAEQRKITGEDGILGVHPTATVSEDKRIEPVAPVTVEKKTMPSLVSWGDRAASLITAVHA